MSTCAWLEKPMVGFDLETTGVDVENDRIVTASLVTINDGPVDARHYLVNPGVPIPAAATAVHGISDADAANGLPPETALDVITKRLLGHLEAGTPIVTMNGVYDITLLDRECRRHQFALPVGPTGRFSPVIDVRVIDKHIDPYRRGGRKLTDLCRTYGVKHDGAHDATEDALAAARVLWKIVHKHPEIGALSLDELHDAQIGWAWDQHASFARYRARIGQPLTEPHGGVWPVRPVTV